MTERSAMERLERWTGWERGVYIPFFNDCQDQPKDAFEDNGIPYPGIPSGRLDVDNIYPWDAIQYYFRNPRTRPPRWNYE